MRGCIVKSAKLLKWNPALEPLPSKRGKGLFVGTASRLFALKANLCYTLVRLNKGDKSKNWAFLMGKLILILGGARSGKSTYAQKLAGEVATGSGRVAYVATGVACDDEMRARFEQHQRSRPPEWMTIETPTEVAQAIHRAGDECAVMIVDCLTTLITNWLAEIGQLEEPTESMAALEGTILGQVEGLVRAARGARTTVIVVSNEVGLGVVPSFKAGRMFRDLAGLANQFIAREADEVYMMWAGIPQKIKGGHGAENKR